MPLWICEDRRQTSNYGEVWIINGGNHSTITPQFARLGQLYFASQPQNTDLPYTSELTYHNNIVFGTTNQIVNYPSPNVTDTN